MTGKFIAVVPLVTSLLSSIGMVVFAVPPRLEPDVRIVRCADLQRDLAQRAPDRSGGAAAPQRPGADHDACASPHGKLPEAQSGILGARQSAAKCFLGRLAMLG